MSEFSTTVARVVQKAKLHHGGVEELSRAIGISRSTIHNWRAGISEPSFKEQLDFAKKSARFFSDREKEISRANTTLTKIINHEQQ